MIISRSRYYDFCSTMNRYSTSIHDEYIGNQTIPFRTIISSFLESSGLFFASA